MTIPPSRARGSTGPGSGPRGGCGPRARSRRSSGRSTHWYSAGQPQAAAGHQQPPGGGRGRPARRPAQQQHQPQAALVHQVPGEGPVTQPPHRPGPEHPARAAAVPPAAVPPARSVRVADRGGHHQQREQRRGQCLRAAVRAVPAAVRGGGRPGEQCQMPQQYGADRRAERHRRAQAAPYRHRRHRAQQELRRPGHGQVVQQPLALRRGAGEGAAEPPARPGRAGPGRQQGQRAVAAPAQERQQRGRQQVEPGFGAERPGGRVAPVHLDRGPGLEQRQRPERGGDRYRGAQQQRHRQAETGGQQVQRPDPGEPPPVEDPGRNARPGVGPGQDEAGEHEEEGDPVPAEPDQRTEERHPVVFTAQVVEHHQQRRPEAQPGERGQGLTAGVRAGSIHALPSLRARWGPAFRRDLAQRPGTGRSHGSPGGKNRSGARNLGSRSRVEPVSEGYRLGPSTE